MAHDLRLPIVRLVDGSGGGGSVKTLETERRSFVPFNPGWEWVVANLSTVPVVSLCLGSVAGLGAARVVTSHYSVMVKATSQLFVAGPPVVARLGEDVDKETLGGSAIHTRNGVVDDEVATEAEAIARVRRFLSYLPSSVDELPPRPERRRPVDPPIVGDRLHRPSPRPAQGLQGPRDHRGGRRPRLVHGARAPLRWTGRHRARAPRTVGRSSRATRTTTEAAGPRRVEKVTRFVDLADTFHLPVVHLVDNPGFVIGTDAEKAADDPLRRVLWPRSIRRRRRGAR